MTWAKGSIFSKGALQTTSSFTANHSADARRVQREVSPFAEPERDPPPQPAVQ
jgi:hypothetical protein